tara:strand:+ start:90 stop:239 length:150 start_codon:yes stop_codon:yes gene_type:complete
MLPVGLGILLNNYWIILGTLPTVISLYHFAIKKEDVYLEKKFGTEYLKY